MIKNIISIVLLLFFNFVGINATKYKLHPDAGLNIFDMTVRHGYQIEPHEIETKDGYLLQVHRILPKVSNKEETNKEPIILMHCLSCSSIDWVNSGPGKSLAYALTDLGYDVWLPNARGNMWSRKHKTLDPDADKEDFWNFSFHEIGVYDIPAVIDYVLKNTSFNSLQYIGHSQGTTAFFVMASERPEYSEKVKLMQALAPAAYMEHLEGPLVKTLSKYVEDIEFIVKSIGVHEFLPHTKIPETVGKTICHPDSPLRKFCTLFISLIAGFDTEQYDENFIPVMLTNLPAGTSSNQYIHYAYNINYGGFGKFGTPGKEYDLGKVNVSIALHYGSDDFLVALKDVDELKNKLGKNVVYDELYKGFNHFDFLWARDVFDILYADVIALVNEFNYK